MPNVSRMNLPFQHSFKQRNKTILIMNLLRFAGQRVFVFCSIASCGLLSACTAVRPYRTGVDPVHYDNFAHYMNTDPVVTNIIEMATNYTLGFVEFDDQGWLYASNRTGGRWQIDAVMDEIRSEIKTNPLLIVVFVHGWKHNARYDDENVKTFHKVLQQLGKLERQRSVDKSNTIVRHVFGVYVGWRGLSAKWEPFKEISFFSRKSAAETVGHGAVVELLSDLEAVRTLDNQANAASIAHKERDATALIGVGHSFGADVLYSATAPILKERMVENFNAQGAETEPRTFGDMVILINPAFEAARFATLQRLAVNKHFKDQTNCTLAVFTSKGDTATGFWFPLGRRVSTLFMKYQDRGQQRKANIAAVGHYDPYINFELRTLPPQKKVGTNDPAQEVAGAKETLGNIRALKQTKAQKALSYEFEKGHGYCKLVANGNYKTNDPVFNVAVDRAIIPDHDTITQPRFGQFLMEFYGIFTRDED